jgi:hypothetical protein
MADSSNEMVAAQLGITHPKRRAIQRDTLLKMKAFQVLPDPLEDVIRLYILGMMLSL